MELYHQYGALLSIETALPLSQGFLLVMHITFFGAWGGGKVGVCPCGHLWGDGRGTFMCSFHQTSIISLSSITEALIDAFPLQIVQNCDIMYRLV
jgi:hypothetical protein